MRYIKLIKKLHNLSFKETDNIVRLIFHEFENYLITKQFDEVDSLFEELDPVKMLTESIMAVLVLTRFEKELMSNRVKFLEKAREELYIRIGGERTEKLLKYRE